MKPINVEITIEHDTGISESYYRPKEKEVLEDYLKAADLLTINRENSKLQKQVEKIKQEKDEEIRSIREDVNSVLDKVQYSSS